jgi:endogenous inhibitor of DNA gyrase (YacG/DUF329 family)
VTDRKNGCPICGRKSEAGFRPFCSKRCADVDLGRWLGERYVVTEPVEDEDLPDLDRDDTDDGSNPAGRRPH